ncbi:hypothetical protein SKAU_G00303280 [Synaphobranchus kaupii]|uniref:Uncharacterized protein n=1 Tax=Synaphobranchus kaupii TaxID=118154 RepID=A0A9Q1ILD0_SYNKA|nr:hypothetical protein SKAU_G00303280 [Synaphobranchus kaupii]
MAGPALPSHPQQLSARLGQVRRGPGGLLKSRAGSERGSNGPQRALKMGGKRPLDRENNGSFLLRTNRATLRDPVTNARSTGDSG